MSSYIFSLFNILTSFKIKLIKFLLKTKYFYYFVLK